MSRINNYSQFLKLFESQVFDFEECKDDVFRYIDCVKNKNKDDYSYKNRLGIGEGFIYRLITNQLGGNSKYSDLLVKNGFMKMGEDLNKFFDKIQDKWINFFGQKMFREYYDDGKIHPIPNSSTTSEWVQKYYNPNKFKRESKYTINYYITISKDSENVSKFLSSLSDLDRDFIKLSDGNKTPLAWKIVKSSLLEFLRHNDSLKVFYYRADQGLKSQIEKTVTEWCKRNGIKTEPRTHTHGFDEEGISYGQKLADIIDKRFEEIILKNGDGVSNQKYFEIFKKLVPDQIKSINIKF